MKQMRSMKHALILITAVAVGIAGAVLPLTGTPAQAAPGDGVPLTLGQEISMQVTNTGLTDRYLRHSQFLVQTDRIDVGSSAVDKGDASYTIRPALDGTACFSFESRNLPSHFLRHEGYRIKIAPRADSAGYRQDATFCAQQGLSGTGVSLVSRNYPGHYIRHRGGEVWLDRISDDLARRDASWNLAAAWATGNPPQPPTASGFPVSEAQFNQMFPQRIPFYTYAGLVDATRKYTAFTGTGDADTRKREAAAFLANIDHESGQLRYVEEINQANWPLYCDRSQPYGCPAGESAYRGRGPIQLSWNYNYKAAGDALGIDLLNNPDLVKNNASVAWQTGVWYWMTQNGPNTQTAHSAIIGSQGFAGTIRSINGALECDGRNPATVQSRVTTYQRFAQILGVNPGVNLYC